VAYEYFRFGGLSGELKDDGTKYIFWCQMFGDLIDCENGNFLHFPFPGSYLEQPHITMLILKIIKVEYVKFLQDQAK